MGEEKNPFFEPSFNLAVKVRSRDERLTSDAGVILVREADHRLGLTESLAIGLDDPRDPVKIRYKLIELLRERIFAQVQGYTSADDLDRLAHDPALRLAAWDRPGDHVLEERLASQPTQSRLLRTLTISRGNREALRSALPDWVGRHLRASGRDHAVARGTIDVDSFPVVARGLQAGSAYNGHYKKRVYHPLVAAFSPGGDYGDRRVGDGFVHAVLRRGNVSSAGGALRFIRNAVGKCSEFCRKSDVRFDSAFANGPIMDPLTEDGTRFLGLLQRNKRLSKLARPHLTRPAGRPPTGGYEKVVELGDYKAGSWKYLQRLVLVVVDKPDPKTGQLELFPHYFFLVTNWHQEEISGWDLLEHYRRRGTFEDRIGEFSQGVSANLSSPTFPENEVTLLLSLLAFNLGSMLRRELEVSLGTGWGGIVKSCG